MASTRYRRRSPVLAAVLGLAMLLVGAGLLIHQVLFWSRSVQVTATVVGSSSYHAGGRVHCSGLTYNPKVKFTAHGQQISTELMHSKTCVRPTPGDTVEVRYDRSNPSVAQSSPATTVWAAPVIALAGGIVLLILAVRTGQAGRQTRSARGT